jgi:hypothetical protein
MAPDEGIPQLMCQPDSLAVFEKTSPHCLKKTAGFRHIEKTRSQSTMTRTISTESILITRESNWIQRRVWRMNGRRKPSDPPAKTYNRRVEAVMKERCGGRRVPSSQV